MPLTLVPDDRPVPRIANLTARGGVRRENLDRALAARRVVDGHDDDSVVESTATWWNRISDEKEFWVGMVVGMLMLIGVAAIVSPW